MRLVVAIAFDEPWSSVSRLVAYGAYAQRIGLSVVFALLPRERERRPFDLAAFSPTLSAPAVALTRLEPSRDDVVMFSTPQVHHAMEARYGKITPRFIHLIQSGVAASVLADVGYGYRLLSKPLKRIVVSAHAEATIRRLVGDGVAMERIDAAFDLGPFAQEISAKAPFAAAINAFDNELTGEALDVARQRGFTGKLNVVAAQSPLEVRAAAYRNSAVLISSPRLGEGVCQPVHEAMAAGCAIIMADCEAVRSLPDGAAPAILVPQDHRDGIVEALLELAGLPAKARLPMQQAAQRSLPLEAARAARAAEEAAASAAFAAFVAEPEGV
ncbi:MAG: glycosyltransferase [Pseudomonadota bacterium]